LLLPGIKTAQAKAMAAKAIANPPRLLIDGIVISPSAPVGFASKSSILVSMSL
jgi:hypothetical protein